MSKKTNDQIILEQILSEKTQEMGLDLSIQDYFEIYSASETLKDHDLSYDDIQYGIVGNGGDGRIDSIHTFLNGEHIKEATSIIHGKRSITPSMSIRFGAFFGQSDTFWHGIQVECDFRVLAKEREGLISKVIPADQLAQTARAFRSSL